MATSPPNCLYLQGYLKAASSALSFSLSSSTTFLTQSNQLHLLFADDTKCIKTISSPHDSSSLQDDLNALTNWSSHWKLAFSSSKCKLLRVPPPNQILHPANYSVNNSTISSTSLHRDLGILVSSNLTWDDHYSAIISKAYRALYFIQRATSHSLSSQTKLSLYKSLVRPNISYCSQIWRPYKIKHIKLFESIQRRATKFILQDFQSDYKTRLTNLHLFPLSLWFEYLDLTFIIKCLKDPSDHLTYFNIFSLCPTIPVLLLLVNSNALFLVLLLTPFTSFTSTVLLEFGTLFLLSTSHYLPQPSRN